MISFEQILKKCNEQKSHLTENLVKAELSVLDSAMEKDTKLAKFITTPARELPKNYQYLVQEVAPNMMDNTLYDIIEITLNNAKLRYVSFFSKKGDNFEGFAAYQVTGDEITSIKMFSLNQNPDDFTFPRDLDDLIANILLPNYRKISWSALVQNPANKTYRRTIKKFNGNSKTENGITYYWIEKQN